MRKVTVASRIFVSKILFHSVVTMSTDKLLFGLAPNEAVSSHAEDAWKCMINRVSVIDKVKIAFGSLPPDCISIVGPLKSGKSTLLNQIESRFGGVKTRAVAFVKYDFRSAEAEDCLLYTSPSPRDRQKSRMPSSA